MEERFHAIHQFAQTGMNQTARHRPDARGEWADCA
jgi:hypothetical protein